MNGTAHSTAVHVYCFNSCICAGARCFGKTQVIVRTKIQTFRVSSCVPAGQPHKAFYRRTCRSRCHQSLHFMADLPPSKEIVGKYLTFSYTNVYEANVSCVTLASEDFIISCWSWSYVHTYAAGIMFRTNVTWVKGKDGLPNNYKTNTNHPYIVFSELFL